MSTITGKAYILTRDGWSPTGVGATTFEPVEGWGDLLAGRFLAPLPCSITATFAAPSDCPCGGWPPALELLFGERPHRCHWSRSHRHPGMAPKPSVAVKPSARSRRRVR